MEFRRSHRALTLLAACCFFYLCAGAAEVLDNEKLLKLIDAGVSLKVIQNKIQAAPYDCHFIDNSDATIAIQTACSKAKWPQADTDALQTKVIELAQQGIKSLKGLVSNFINECINNDKEENPAQYDETMRKMVKEGPKVVQYLLDNLSQENDRARAGALEALEKIGDQSPIVVKQCMLMLDDRTKPVRAQAAATVAALAGPETGEQLVAMLRRTDGRIDAVILALGYLKYEKATDEMVQLLKNGLDSDTRGCAAFALGQMRARAPNAREALLLAVLDEKDEKLRLVAAKALALIGDSRTPGYIIKAFERFRTGRKEILRVLGNFRNIPAAEYLATQLDGDDPEIRKVAQETLEIMTAEHYESREQWDGFIKTLPIRPGWQESKQPNRLDYLDPAK